MNRLIIVNYDNGSKIPGTRMVGTVLEEKLSRLYKNEKEIAIFSANLIESKPSVMIGSLQKFLNDCNPNDRIIALGGDHSIAVPFIERFLKLSNMNGTVLILFDAHLDYFGIDKETNLKNWNFVKYVYKFFEKIICVGWRNIEYPIEGSDLKITIIKACQIDSNWKAVKEYLLSFKKDQVYVSLDLDFFSPVDVPGVSYPLSNGPKFQSAIKLYTSVMNYYKPKTLDICEYNPMIENNRTKKVIMHILNTFLKGRV